MLFRSRVSRTVRVAEVERSHDGRYLCLHMRKTFVAAGGFTPPSGIGTISTPIWNPLTGFIYVGSSDGNLYKISPADGSVAGTRVINTGFTIGDPSVDVFMSRLIVGDTQGRIYSFSVF